MLLDRSARGAATIPLPLLLAGFASLVAVLVVLLLAGGGGGGAGPAERPAPPEAPEQPAPSGLLGGRTSVGPGDRGAAVRGVQAALGALGLDAGVPDGQFGGATAAAAAAFQQAVGLEADGVVGGSTAAALARALRDQAATDASTAEEGLERAVRAGRVPAADAKRYRAIVAAALATLDRGPLAQGAYLAVVLDGVAAQAADYNRPRALALFSMVEANRAALAKPLPKGSQDVEGKDGAVYRFVPRHGFQFHPLAAFARLNALAAQGRRAETERLADALVARAVRAGPALTWEYYFVFGGPPRWISGFAQAVGAQALARAGALLGEAKLLARARDAYRAIPGNLSRPLAGGVWVREYGYSDMAILNAQLQSLVSLSEYAKIADNAGAAAFAGRLEDSTQALLAQFDTGCWSLYALGGSPASPSYHAYHVSLLKKLGDDTGDALWRGTASRWDAYQQARPAGPCP